MRSILRIALSLTLLCIITSGVLVFARTMTSEKIKTQQLSYVQGAILKEILKEASNNPIEDRFDLSYGDTIISFFPAYFLDGQKAIAFEIFGNGFSGKVGVMIVVNIQTQQVLGIDITTHNETPGIGSLAKTTYSFKNQFTRFKIGNDFRPRHRGGEIDVITGATLTSSAVCEAVENAGKIYHKLSPEIMTHLK